MCKDNITIKTLTIGDLIDELKSIFAPLDKYDSSKVQVFVHGSWADNSRTAFSDLDDFIIIDDDYYPTIESSLQEIEYNFQKIDTIQHHGHWLIYKSQLNDYNNSYMPLFIMENAICIKGNNEINSNINHVKTQDGLINAIKTTCKNIEDFYELYKNDQLNIYNLKCFVGSFALLPPLIFQLKNIQLDKKTAINRSNEIFSQESLRLIQWSTDLREKWNLLTESEVFNNFSNKISQFQNINKWREFAKNNAPIIDSSKLSEIKITSDLVQKFVIESLSYIDNVKLKKIELEEYSDGYSKVEQIAIEKGAILVGQFGTIKYPSISDLDMFICFEDVNYQKGCEAVDNYIRNNNSLNYLFTHSPMYVNKSMLHKIKYLHTLNGLILTYNFQNIKLDHTLNRKYEDYLNKIWSYAFYRFSREIKHNIKYCDIRYLLLYTKNLQVSIDNLERIMKRPTTNVLERSKDLRKKVLVEGQSARKDIEKELIRTITDFENLLKILDKETLFSKICGEFRIYKNIILKNSKQTYTSYENGNYIYYTNSFFYKLILGLLFQSSKEARIFYSNLRYDYKVFQKIGGDINRFVWVIPESCIANNFYIGQLITLKYVMKKNIKNILNKINK